MDNILNLILAFLWAFVIAVFAIPSIIRLAHERNLLDEPNFRAVHTSLTPRLGGLAIYAGFISALTIFGTITPQLQRLIAGSMLLFFIGMKDDVQAISPFKKFFVQFLATGILVFIGGLRITSFQGFLGIHELNEGVSYGLTILVIVGITNAVNLIDGLDGLAGSLTLVMASVFGLAFFRMGEMPYAFMAVCLLGSVVGFLRYNITKAIIFMGDTGSLTCGFLVSVMAVEFLELNKIQSAPSVAIATMIVPIFDTARVFTLRILKGKSPFSPDQNHIHHVLKRAGFKQLQIVGILVAFNALMVLLVGSLAFLGDNILVPAIVVVFLATSGLLTIYDRSNKIKQYKNRHNGSSSAAATLTPADEPV